MKLDKLIKSLNPQPQNYKVLKKIIAHHTDLPYHKIYSWDYQISDKKISLIEKDYQSHILDDKPLSYIFSKAKFYEYELQVSESTLIPRPESEKIIDIINSKLSTSTEPHHLIDVGTGSWCLGITSILQNPDKLSTSALLDISPSALKIAQSNYDTLTKNINTPQTYIQKSNLLEWYMENISTFPHSNTIIIANLPYISPREYSSLPDKIKNREPKSALVASKEWLYYYHQLLKQIINISKSKQFHILLETTPSQATTIKDTHSSEFSKFITHSTHHFNIKILEAQS